jgi:hypothetical protein
MRRKRTPEQKRALQAAAVARFVRLYGRKAQKRIEPNDRRYDRKTETWISRLPPTDLDHLLREDEDEP